jgi:hypothetical protein
MDAHDRVVQQRLTLVCCFSRSDWNDPRNHTKSHPKNAQVGADAPFIYRNLGIAKASLLALKGNFIRRLPELRVVTELN